MNAARSLVVALPLLASAPTAAAPWRVVRLVLLLGTPFATAVVGWLIGSPRDTVARQPTSAFPSVGIAIPFVSDTPSAVLLAVTGIATFVVLLALARVRTPDCASLPRAGPHAHRRCQRRLPHRGRLWQPSSSSRSCSCRPGRAAAADEWYAGVGSNVGRLFVVSIIRMLGLPPSGFALLHAAAGTVNLACPRKGAGRSQSRSAPPVVPVRPCRQGRAVLVHGWLLAYPRARRRS